MPPTCTSFSTTVSTYLGSPARSTRPACRSHKPVRSGSPGRLSAKYEIPTRSPAPPETHGKIALGAFDITNGFDHVAPPSALEIIFTPEPISSTAPGEGVSSAYAY